MNKAQIIGIFLVKNEDIFIEQAVLNVLDFCDLVLIADNYSSDCTWDIVQSLAKTFNKITCQRIKKTDDSHEMIKGYAGTDTWVFGVDGDETYDPNGLVRFREEIQDGNYDNWWVLFGNVLNCIKLDLVNKEAEGYLAPPCRSMTKLYNFRAISSWNGPCLERMLGGTPVFKEGFNANLRLNLHEQISWEDSLYRCLHTCFLRRSSLDPSAGEDRPNPVELSSRSFWDKLGLGFLSKIGGGKKSLWKKEKYLRGPLVTLNVASFFPEKKG
jgi:glycosyltransferase involved in cell wall biosynthesis